MSFKNESQVVWFVTECHRCELLKFNFFLDRAEQKRRKEGYACKQTFEGMQSQRHRFVDSLHCSCIIIVTAVVIQVVCVVSVAVPSSNCYALDYSSRLVDFDTDVVVRFCKDVEARSQMVVCKTMFSSILSSSYFIRVDTRQYIRICGFWPIVGGYVDFGRFNNFNHFVAGSGRVNFVQATSNLSDKKYLRILRVFVELAIPCEKPGPRVFEGFTVGFHPQSREIVYNGMTQPGFEKSHQDFSLTTEQTQVTLYMTAIASLSTLVRKPIIKVLPEKGLKVRLSGSGATGSPPTTLTPTLLNVEWICLEARNTPYEVNFTIPIEGYEPIQFFLTKICEHRQDQREDSTRGWAIFGIISCMQVEEVMAIHDQKTIAVAMLAKLRGNGQQLQRREHGSKLNENMVQFKACMTQLQSGNMETKQ
ncbi:unnamed protein product [Dovyalis caffra]|uniref:Uncharacterized protein n=1 Tax=Dovyalis caffra TaxID=77055 RepID=A0AAV1RQR8_9ROSI|nr:unnamed protein product [Dovyalis caffra]